MSLNNSSLTFTYEYHYQPFRLEALPVRFGELPVGLLQNAVNEFSATRKCGPDLGYLSAIGALSLAMQNLYDVETPNGHRFPTSMMLVGVGGPTSGKSAAGNYFLQAIDEFEVENADHLPSAGFLHKDTNGAALFSGLSQLPTAGLVSYEGSEILNGIARTQAAKLNAIWSGETVKIHRKTSRSLSITGARLTMLALVHPGRFQKFLCDHGDRLRDVGFLARLMVIEAEDRPFPDEDEASPEPCREAFNRRILELLERNIEAASDPHFKPEVVRFDKAAGRIWLKYAAQLKHDGRPGGRFELAPEHATRLSQNAARLAALLRRSESDAGDIDERTLYTAIAICEAASRSFMKLCVPEIREELDADFLDNWIERNRRQRGVRFIPRLSLRRNAPNRLRDSEILNPLIEVLISRGRIAQYRKNGTWHLDLSPWLGGWLSPQLPAAQPPGL